MRPRFRDASYTPRTAEQVQPNSASVAQTPAHHTDTPVHHQKTSRVKKLSFFFGRKWLVVVIILVIAGFVALTLGYLHTKDQLNKAKNPTLAGKTETEQITNQVSKSIALPTGETPTLATVSDVSKLKNQTFFKNAQNGDKVLIYTKSGRALLYRPSTKKVIEYSLVSLNGQQ